MNAAEAKKIADKVVEQRQKQRTLNQQAEIVSQSTKLIEALRVEIAEVAKRGGYFASVTLHYEGDTENFLDYAWLAKETKEYQVARRVVAAMEAEGYQGSIRENNQDADGKYLSIDVSWHV